MKYSIYPRLKNRRVETVRNKFFEELDSEDFLVVELKHVEVVDESRFGQEDLELVQEKQAPPLT